jgi:hypothetical protein
MRNEFESEFQRIENELTELAQKYDIFTDYKQIEFGKGRDSMRKLQRMMEDLMLENNHDRNLSCFTRLCNKCHN